MKIALLGKMRSGKDTVGEYLCDTHNCKRFAFGDEVKDVINTYFPKAFENGKPREHYQVIGQSFRKLNPNIWIERTLEKINTVEQLNPNINIVVTDVRQPNEATELRKRGFTIIKVVAPEHIRLERILAAKDNFNEEELHHETELNVDRCVYDYCITNDGTLEELYREVDVVLNCCQGGC